MAIAAKPATMGLVTADAQNSKAKLMPPPRVSTNSKNNADDAVYIAQLAFFQRVVGRFLVGFQRDGIFEGFRHGGAMLCNIIGMSFSQPKLDRKRNS